MSVYILHDFEYFFWVGEANRDKLLGTEGIKDRSLIKQKLRSDERWQVVGTWKVPSDLTWETNVGSHLHADPETQPLHRDPKGSSERGCDFSVTCINKDPPRGSQCLPHPKALCLCSRCGGGGVHSTRRVKRGAHCPGWPWEARLARPSMPTCCSTGRQPTALPTFPVTTKAKKSVHVCDKGCVEQVGSPAG